MFPQTRPPPFNIMKLLRAIWEIIKGIIVLFVFISMIFMRSVLRDKT